MKKLVFLLALCGCTTQKTPGPIVEALDRDDPYSVISIYEKDQQNKYRGEYGEDNRIPEDVFRNRVNEAKALEKLAETTK